MIWKVFGYKQHTNLTKTLVRKRYCVALECQSMLEEKTGRVRICSSIFFLLHKKTLEGPINMLSNMFQFKNIMRSTGNEVKIIIFEICKIMYFELAKNFPQPVSCKNPTNNYNLWSYNLE